MRKPLLLLTATMAILLARGANAQITVPRWLDPPSLDGKCQDSAYTRGTSLTLRGSGVETKASILHSSVDLYVCLDNLGTGVERIAVGLDPDLSRDSLVKTGDYVFSFTPTGTIRADRGSPDGKLVPLTIASGDAAAGFATGSAELRISLEWLGGYARTAGLSLSVEGKNGAVLRSWPESAGRTPNSWGSLALGPIYEGSSAGSVFLDGREGHLVVPYSPELNPKEITIESWVRALDGDCGTLVGNGQFASYWLAVCEGVRFGHGGITSVRGAPHPLGDGWHHVAVTLDSEGIRTLYVDGSVVLQPGWEPPHETAEGEEIGTPVRLGASVLPLRIGSDRDDSDRDPLHGYVRELRIWNHARTAEEIRETAFENLRGGESGLVALWPFTSDLSDLAGGHDAGLIGNASLAREEPQVSEFPDPPAVQPYTYPKRPPLPAWGARVPAIADAKAMTLDGDCTRAEYARATKLILEPDRSIHMKMLVAGDALYLCTNVVLGKAGGPRSSVTLWIDRDGKPGTQPGPSELRLRLTPNGTLQAGTGSGLGYTGAAPTGLQAKVLTGDRLQVQEDLRPLEAPWWSGEIRIPIKALAPFVAGSSLRFALAYDGEAPASSGLPQQVRALWPASFQELRSDTWGVASTSKPSQQALAASSTGTVTAPLISSSPRTLVSSEPALAAGNRTSPAVADFDNRCPLWLLPTYISDEDFKWPLVDENRPVVQVSGMLTKVYVSGEDSGFIHTSHDVDMKMTLPLADRFATIDGAPNLVLETESIGFPPHRDLDQGARPSVGDHVTALGRWIFDCGHEAKTEIHPIPLFESDRLEVRPLWPGGPQRTVRMVRVWMNSDPEPFGYEFNGPFTFDVELPPAGWSPFLRVIEGDSSQVTATRDGDRMQIEVDPPNSTGAFYFEMMVGHLGQPEDGLSRSWRTATMGSWEVEILDDHDHGFPPDCLSIAWDEDCGELYYAVNVNGIWRQILWNDQLASSQRRLVLDSVPVGGPRLNIQVTGYEEDPTIPHGGGEPLSPDPNQDPLDPSFDGFDRGLLDQPVTSPIESPGGDWRLHYSVTPGGELAASLVEQSFWSPRLDGEPNDDTPISLGTLPVPARNAAALLTTRDGFLTEPPTGFPPNGQITLFDPEVDRYKFGLTDFADVELLPLPSPLRLDVKRWNPWHAPGSLPATLKVEIAPNLTAERNTDDVMGFPGARLKVSSPDGRAGDRPYSVQVRTSYRDIARDWGEARDVQGRVIDLVADPRVQIEPASPWFPLKRVLEADWAWQHVAGDTDLYQVILPPVPGPPAGHAACQFDLPGRLIIRADRMTITSPLKNGSDKIDVDDLRAVRPNGGAVLVTVTASGARRLYQFEAEWHSSRYYTASECEELRQQMAMFRRLTPEGELEIMKGIIALQGGRYPGQSPWPGPDPDPTDLPPLGDFRVIRFEKGGPLDLIVSSPEDQPVLARLFDETGVLLGESEGLDEETAAKTPAPAGMAPHSRLRVDGLEAGGTYLLQVVHRERDAGRQQMRLGFDQVPR